MNNEASNTTRAVIRARVAARTEREHRFAERVEKVIAFIDGQANEHARESQSKLPDGLHCTAAAEFYARVIVECELELAVLEEFLAPLGR